MRSESSTASARPPYARVELLERARALAPRLAERAAEAERLRRLPDETVRDFHQAGLFRVLQPRRIGGAELDYAMLVELGAILAHGCASSAWTLTTVASHHWMLAMFPERAQKAVWGADPDALIAASFIFPAGRARAVTNGYLLSGRWPLATGVDLCSWSMLGAIVGGEDENAPAEYRIFLVPRMSYRVLDTWHAGGLEGTGSNDVEMSETFVPAELTLAADRTKGGETPGSAVNPAPLYRIPVFATFPYVRSGTALGIAESAVAVFIDSSSHRTTSYTGVPLSDQQAVHIRLAEASARVDAARLMMIDNCVEAQRLAEEGRIPDILSKVRYRRDGAFTVGLCAHAVDLLHEGSGGGAVYLRSRLQRAFRDVHAARAHTAFSNDAAGSVYGRVAFGQSADNPTL